MRYLYGLAILLGSVPSVSQVTDVAQKVTDALTAFGPVPHTVVTVTSTQVTLCPIVGICGPFTVNQTSTTVTNSVLTASGIEVVKSASVTWGTPTQTELPQSVTVSDYVARNCTATPATPTFSVSTAFQTSASVALANSISHSVTKGISFTSKFSDAFSATASLSFTDGTSSTTTDTTGNTSIVTTQRSGSQAVPAQTFLVIELQTWPVHYSITFNTTATIDADLSANDKGYKRLSDILSETQRTFPISGTLQADNASSGVLVFYNIPFDASKCPSAPTSVKFSKLTLEQGTKLVKVKTK
jgi:hypothetical protein